MNIAILSAVVLVGIANIVVSIVLLREEMLSPLQKLGQLLVIWILPILGFALILAFIGAHYTREEMKKRVPFPFYLASRKVMKDGSDINQYTDVW